MPDRPGETGPDVTKGRATRTAASEEPVAGKGPKRPGSPAARKPTASAPNGSGQQSNRTRTGAGRGSGSARGSKATEATKKAPPPTSRSKAPRATSKTNRAEKPSSDGDASSTPKMAVGSASTDVSSTDATTEITGLDHGTGVRPRQRTRRPATSEGGAPAVAPSSASPDLAEHEEGRRARTRTTPAARRGRRVKRVIRRIELWSVLKLAVVLYTCMYLAILLTLAVLWGLAYSSGQIENIETFMGEVGLDNYRFYGDRMFKAVAAIGAVGVLAGTVLTVLGAALVNIISEITGGIRVVVIEEEPVRGGRA